MSSAATLSVLTFSDFPLLRETIMGKGSHVYKQLSMEGIIVGRFSSRKNLKRSGGGEMPI